MVSADPLRHGVIGGGCHAVDLLRWLGGDPVEVFSPGCACDGC